MGLHRQRKCPTAAGARSSDPAGNGLAQGFAAILTVVLWIVLAIVLLIARSHGAIPGWATASLIVLVPLSAIGMCMAIAFWGDRGGWLIAIPVVTPLLLAFYAAWARLPALQGLLSGDIASAAIVAVLALAIALPFVSLAF